MAVKRRRELSTDNTPYPYPSKFGSHSSMIDEAETQKLNLDSSLVVIKDEFGMYVTKRNRLDSGLADPNRYVDRGPAHPSVIFVNHYYKSNE